MVAIEDKTENSKPISGGKGRDDNKKKASSTKKAETVSTTATTKTTATNDANTNRKKIHHMSGFIIMGFIAFLSVLIAMVLKQPISWSMYTTGSLWGEIELTSPTKAKQFANLSIHEAKTIWEEPTSNWHTMYNNTPTTTSSTTTISRRKNSSPSKKKSGSATSTKLPNPLLTVECRRVTEGHFRDSDIQLARSEGIFRNITRGGTTTAAQKVFDYMISPKGFDLILDHLAAATTGTTPVTTTTTTNNNNNQKENRNQKNNKRNTAMSYQSIERITDWRQDQTQAKIEIGELVFNATTTVSAAAGGLLLGSLISNRHFLVLHSIIPEERILVIKSIVHSSRPGASAMYTGKEEKQKQQHHDGVRSIITFAIQVDTTTTTSSSSTYTQKVEKNGEVQDDNQEEEEEEEAEQEEVVVVRMINYVNLFLLHESIMTFASCKWLFPNLYRDLQVALDSMM